MVGITLHCIQLLSNFFKLFRKTESLSLLIKLLQGAAKLAWMAGLAQLLMRKQGLACSFETMENNLDEDEQELTQYQTEWAHEYQFWGFVVGIIAAVLAVLVVLMMASAFSVWLKHREHKPAVNGVKAFVVFYNLAAKIL